MPKHPLVPCAACERHVRADESRCPFCGETGSKAAPPLPKLPKGRLSSLFVMTFHAATAVSATIGCGGETTDPGPGSTGGAAGHSGTPGNAGSQTTGTGGDSAGAGGFTLPGGGGKPSTGTGGRANVGTGGSIDTGDGGFSQGGAVPIYRATPRG